MAYDSFDTILQQACTWADHLQQAGWISPEAVKPLQEIRLNKPGQLFQADQSRPLCVAFMGGTGVGKSSLLNRLAGQAIAKVGIERPTSKEVTLYHHQSLSLAQLPAQLPLDKVRIAQHNHAEQQQLLWIDMPDFDSTEQSNQHLVLQWLPYIDVLIYVVSPERYRDNKAWQMLLSEGAKHAWIFVLNQWDKGCTEQLEDFKKQLALANFKDPWVFKTDCTGTLPDEFGLLQQTLGGLANQHTIQQLESRGLQTRQKALQQAVEQIIAKLGNETSFEQLLSHWEQNWETTAGVLNKAFAWPIKIHSEHYAEQASSLVSSNKEQALWDEWSQTRLNDALDQLVLQADVLQLPASPVKQAVQDTRQQAGQWLATTTGLEVRQALANPGNALQRGLLKFSLFCEVVLPIVAMGWVGYQVFQGYYQSAQTHTNYLGEDFAIHSALLIGLSWLIPFFLRRKLKPSLQKAALKGLHKGVEQGLNQLDISVANTLLELRKQGDAHSKRGLELINVSREAVQSTAVTTSTDSALGRMLTGS